MNGKIILMIVMLVAVISGTIGGYLYREHKKTAELNAVSQADPVEEELPPAVGDVDISLSPVDDLVLPDLNMEKPDFDLADGIAPDLPETLSTSTNGVAAPQIELELEPENIDTSGIITGDAAGSGAQNSPDGGAQTQNGALDQADCAQFAQITDCSAVPPASRTLCEQCQ